MWLIFILISAVLQCACSLISDWTIPLEFSVAGAAFRSLGKLVIREFGEGEFVGNSADVEKHLFDAFKAAIKDNKTAPAYTIKGGDVQSSTFPCLFLHSNLAHEISVSVDLERRKVHSLTVFPQGLYDVTDADSKVHCDQSLLLSSRPKLSANVKVMPLSELPSPDTTSYLQRIEDEKRARQHGATQDNRSFIAKYWMYIVPVVIFMVVSNAFNGDQQAPAE